MFNRKEKAKALIATISKSISDVNVSLRGSVFAGKDDELSDIDISVKHSNMKDIDIANSVIKSMKIEHDVLFEDWATAFLPKECVITFFIKDYPLHCFVETSIVVPKNNQTLKSEQISRKYPDHFLKIWIIAIKRFIRNTKNVDLQYLSRVLLQSDVAEVGGPLIVLKKTFDSIAEESKQKYPTLYTSCVKYLNYIEHGDSPDLEVLAVPQKIVSFLPT